MRRPIVAGNWKMNGTVAEATDIVAALLGALPPKPGPEVVVCPPFTLLDTVARALGEGPVTLGAQDVFWAEKGAFTGRVSAGMLRDAGVTYCVVGHSETRGRFGRVEVPGSTLAAFGETDETVNLKVGALIRVGIAPIVCVGETAAERADGRTDAVVERQVRAAVAGHESAVAGMAVAYEPVWAIGTGDTCPPDEADRVCGLVRRVLAGMAGDRAAAQCRVLYGGSVNQDNAAETFAGGDVDGGLVGGASLDGVGFARIVQAANG